MCARDRLFQRYYLLCSLSSIFRSLTVSSFARRCKHGPTTPTINLSPHNTVRLSKRAHVKKSWPGRVTNRESERTPLRKIVMFCAETRALVSNGFDSDGGPPGCQQPSGRQLKWVLPHPASKKDEWPARRADGYFYGSLTSISDSSLVCGPAHGSPPPPKRTILVFFPQNLFTPWHTRPLLLSN